MAAAFRIARVVTLLIFVLPCSWLVAAVPKNGTFDRDVTGWTSTAMKWSSLDANGSTSSGSAQLSFAAAIHAEVARTCVGRVPGHSAALSGKVLIPSGTGTVHLRIGFFGSADCAGPVLSTSEIAAATGNSDWNAVGGSASRANSTRSAAVIIAIDSDSPFEAYVDDVMFRSAPHDFDRDGVSDLVWRQRQSGFDALWRMSGGGIGTGVALGPWNAGWTLAGIGDFQGDGIPDLLWRMWETNAIWFMTREAKPVIIQIESLAYDWLVAGIGDFNGDGISDILWHNSRTGENSVWIMNGAYVAVRGDLPALRLLREWEGEWKAVIGDFNADGYSDIAWSAKSGEKHLWFMIGINVAAENSMNRMVPFWGCSGVSGSWRPQAAGDFDGDGMDDLVWFCTDEMDPGFNITLLNGGQYKEWRAVHLTNPYQWRLETVGDFDGDGKADIMWRNGDYSSTGEQSIWLMDGTTCIRGVALPTIPWPWFVY